MENLKLSKVHQIITKCFQAKLKRNPSYSQRALARDLGTSSVFVNNILTGKKSVPSSRFKRLFKILDMDITSQTELLRAAVLDALPSKELKQMAKLSLTKDSSMEKYAKQEASQFTILSNWYTVAILNYVACENLEQSIDMISNYFGVHPNDVQNSLDGLLKLGLIQKVDGRFIKTDCHSYFATTKSQVEVRNFHRQTIQKSLGELNKVSQDDFDKRLITGFTMSTNPEKVDLAKKMISEFLAEVSEVLCEENCTDVYQFNIQLFPLKASKGESK